MKFCQGRGAVKTHSFAREDSPSAASQSQPPKEPPAVEPERSPVAEEAAEIRAEESASPRIEAPVPLDDGLQGHSPLFQSAAGDGELEQEQASAALLEEPELVNPAPAADPDTAVPSSRGVAGDSQRCAARSLEPPAAMANEEPSTLPSSVPLALPPLSRSTSHHGSPESPFLGAYYGAKGRKLASPGTAASVDSVTLLVRPPTQASKKGGHGRSTWRKFGESFDFTASRDLPPEYRAIQEDNKVLSEELRRVRRRAAEGEARSAALERALLAARGEAARLAAELRACSVSPQALLDDTQYRAALAAREREVAGLAEKVAVLERARESTERRHRAEVAAERRSVEAARAEAARLKEALLDRDRQARMTALHMRTVYQRLETLEAMSRGIQQNRQQPQEAVRVLSPPPTSSGDEVAVKLMLCIVYDEPPPTAAEQAERGRLAAIEAAYLRLKEQQEHRAALVIQTRFRAFRARKALCLQRTAAMTIQAHVRGMLARQRLVVREEGNEPERQSSQDRLKERRLQAEQRHAERSKRRKGFATVGVLHAEEPERPMQRRPSFAQAPRFSTTPDPYRQRSFKAEPGMGRRVSNMGLGGSSAGSVPKLSLAKTAKAST